MTQFLRDQASDSEEVVRPLMLDGTYLSRNFATLGPLTWQPPCNQEPYLRLSMEELSGGPLFFSWQPPDQWVCSSWKWKWKEISKILTRPARSYQRLESISSSISRPNRYIVFSYELDGQEIRHISSNSWLSGLLARRKEFRNLSTAWPMVRRCYDEPCGRAWD